MSVSEVIDGMKYRAYPDTNTKQSDGSVHWFIEVDVTGTGNWSPKGMIIERNGVFTTDDHDFDSAYAALKHHGYSRL